MEKFKEKNEEREAAEQSSEEPRQGNVRKCDGGLYVQKAVWKQTHNAAIPEDGPAGRSQCFEVNNLFTFSTLHKITCSR